MSNLPNNPLAKHFRQPALYIKLPSQGRWYPEGAVDMPPSGEVPIYPMTARDEITMKTPDALLNGASTIHVLESCCPSIKNAWKMPLIDLDPLLIAIRLATYGKQMDFTCACPHCGSQNEKAVDLTYMLDSIKPADWSKSVNINGLEIVLKPQTYEDYNKNNLMNFEEQRLIAVVQNENLSEEEKTQQFDVVFQRLIESGISQVSKSIDYIQLDDGAKVINAEYIRDFLENCEKQVWDMIKERLDEIGSTNTYNQITITCTNEECNKDFVSPFVFEQTNFFG